MVWLAEVRKYDIVSVANRMPDLHTATVSNSASACPHQFICPHQCTTLQREYSMVHAKHRQPPSLTPPVTSITPVVTLP